MNPISFHIFTLALLPTIVISNNSKCDLSSDTLSCSLRTLQSNIDASDREVGAAKNLHIKCSDFFFHESQLMSEHFGKLDNLEKLSIEFCKIRYVPSRALAGLVNLRSFSLQSHNADWSSVLMDIDIDAFQKTTALEDLNLAHNNLWSLPPGMMCGLQSLTSLNVSNTHLLEISNLGLSAGSSSCQVSLTSIDISSNYISAFKGDDLSKVPALTRLNLSFNRLTILADNALNVIPKLRVLDLSSNQLSALPPKVFNESQSIEELYLQNNSLTLITTELFSSMSHLKVLNLSRNAISSHLVSTETFSGLTGLVTLDLSFNKLTKIDDDIFGRLVSLKELFLHNNQIHRLSGNSLMGQIHLEILDLSHNKISSLPSGLFDQSSALTLLRLDNNKIQDTVNISFTCEKLVELTFQENLLTSIPAFIGKCNLLRMLDLANNNIKDIQEGGLSGLVNLYGLSLAGNQISKLSNETFSNMSSNLNMLNLARNKIESIERATFQDMKELRALRLDSNNLSDLNGLISHLTNLNWLNVSSNSIEWFDYAFIPNSLVWLDITHNRVGDLGNFYSLKNFGLQTLEAGFNLITNLNQGSFTESLIHIRLDNNLVFEIDSNTFTNLPNLQMVDLQSNKLQHLSYDALATHKDNVSGRPRFYLSDNPFSCDCNLDWLPLINDNRHHSVAVVADLNEVICIDESERRDEYEPVRASLIVDLSEGDFLCRYETHCSADCLCCDFYACDCRMQCPFGCQCEHNADWTKNIVTCSSQNHTHVPLLIPMDATSLHLDGNHLEHVDQQNFLGRHRVNQLFLNGSNVVSLSDNTFTGLSNLRSLHLEENNLRELRGYEFSGLFHLRELYLQNNEIAYINEVTFEQLHSLEILRLDGNLLTIFPVWKLRSNSILTSLSLSQNLWSCECDFLTPFNDFLETRIKTIADYNDINCVSDNIIQKGDMEPCLSANAIAIQKNETKPPKLSLATILVPATIAVVMVILGFLAVCVFRKNIKSWLYKKSSSTIYESSSSGSSMASNGSQKNRLFDVYVTYSDIDSEFVHHSLAPTLENGTYRLCLQKRDFPSSAPVFDTISVAADSSERVLMVLTESYIKSEWPQTKAPLQHALLHNEAYKDKLIFVLVGKINNDVLFQHPDLCHYLSSCPVISWGMNGYLNQLKFFLPEPAVLTFQRNITMRSFHPPPAAQKNKRQCAAEHNHNTNSMQIYSIDFGSSLNSVYTSRGSDHTYHSIQDHIYHTLEPSLLNGSPVKPESRTQLSPSKLSPFRRNADFVLRLDPASPSTPSPNLPAAIHAYTHSTLSGQQLLVSNESEEYIV